jgi:hypothetical protein
MGYRLDSWGSNPSRGKIFLFSTTPRLVPGPTQPPIQWVLGTLSLGVKWPGCETYHSPPSSAEVKNDGAIPPLPHMPSCHSASLFKHRATLPFIAYTLLYLKTYINFCRNPWWLFN